MSRQNRLASTLGRLGSFAQAHIECKAIRPSRQYNSGEVIPEAQRHSALMSPDRSAERPSCVLPIPKTVKLGNRLDSIFLVPIPNLWQAVPMGNKDARRREVKKPKKKVLPATQVNPPTPRWVPPPAPKA